MKEIIPGLWEFDEIGDTVHCYLWEWDEGVTLIDTGFPDDGKKILQALRQHGYALHSVKRIIITHADVDHIGGLAVIKRATQAPIACHAVEKIFLEEPQRRQPAALWMRPIFWFVTTFLPSYRIRPVVPDELMVDGQQMPEGFTVIHTPGHTPGHISLLHKERRFLISGDALSNRGGKLRLPPPIFTPDIPNAKRSIWRLAKKYGNDFEVVLFGHGPPLMQNGGKRVKGLVSQIYARDT